MPSHLYLIYDICQTVLGSHSTTNASRPQFDLGDVFGDISSGSEDSVDELMLTIASAHCPSVAPSNPNPVSVAKPPIADCIVLSDSELDDAIFPQKPLVIDLCSDDEPSAVNDSAPKNPAFKPTRPSHKAPLPQTKHPRYCQYYSCCARTDIAHFFKFVHPCGHHGQGLIG